MKVVPFAGLIAGALLLSACATTETPAPAPAAATPVAVPKPVVKAPPPAPAPRSMLTMKTGTYQCELNRKVTVKQVSSDQMLAVLNWDRRDYAMRAVQTSTGALRYEDKASGLTWITVVGKSMLLDTRKGRQLANECKA